MIEGTRLVNRLPALLGERKMSIRELSRQTGITYSMVWDVYHSERQSVKYEVLDAICRVLDVQPGDIFVYVPEDEETE
jgi:putative transcriptional regulator